MTTATLQERPPAAAANSWMLHFALLPSNRLSPPPGQSWSWWDQSNVYGTCEAQVKTNAALTHCALVVHVHFVWQYQPASHYWALQGIETATQNLDRAGVKPPRRAVGKTLVASSDERE